MTEDEARKGREQFLIRLEQVSKATVEAAEQSAVTSRRLAIRMQKIVEQLEELNDHIRAFEEFVQSILSTYDDGSDARSDMVEAMKGLGKFVGIFRNLT